MDEDDIFCEDWSDEALACLRARTVLEVKTYGYDFSAPGSFTCDDCQLKRTCTFAFCAYNTDGDCLAEK